MKLISKQTNDERYRNPDFKAYHKNWDDIKDDYFALTYELEDGTLLKKEYNLDGTLASVEYTFGEHDWLKQKKELEDKFYSIQHLTEDELKFLNACKHCIKITGSSTRVLWY